MDTIIRVLFVDDEEYLLDVGRQYLEEEGGFSVITALSAEVALRLFAQNVFDVIVADYAMPGMDGIGLLKKIRAADKTIPFIIFTGRGKEDVVIEALNNGATFYIQKGSDADTLYTELSHMIRQAYQMRRAEITLAEQEQRIHDLQNASDLIQSVAPDGHFLFVNQTWLDTLGYREEEVKDLSIFDIIHEESMQHCQETFRRVIAGENVGIITATFRTKDGKRVNVEGLASCNMTGGSCQYTRGLFHNVTHEREAEAAVRAMVAGMVGTTGMEALDRIAQSISTWLSADLIMIGEITPDHGRVKVLSMLLDGRKVVDYTYDLKGTPCENTAERGFCMYVDNVSTLFPHSRDLREFSIRGYLGTALRNPDGQVTGVLCVLSRRPLALPPSGREIIDIMAAKAAAEIERMSAQDALLQSEIKFRTLVEHSFDGTLIVDPQGKILFANPAAGRIVAATDLEEVIRKKNVLEFIAPDSQEAVLHDFGQVARGIDGFLARYKVITLQQQERWVESVGKTIIFEEEPAILISLKDITDRERADAALRQSEQMFRTMVEISPYPIAINSMSDKKFIAVNPAFLRVSGYQDTEVLGKTPVELGLLSITEMLRLIARATLKGRIVNLPLALTAKGGQKIHILFSTCPVTINGRAAVMTTAAEVTNLKQAEEELLRKNEELNTACMNLTATEQELRKKYEELRRKDRELGESEQRYRSLFENMPEPLLYGEMIYDRAGTPVDFIYHQTNPSFLRLIRREGVTGRRAREVVPGIREENPELFETLGRVAKTGGTETAELLFRPDQRWVRITVYSPEAGRFIAVFSDFTERKHTQDALKKSEELFRNIFSESPLGMVLALPDLRFAIVNPAWTGMLGYREDELQGMTFQDVTHPEDLAGDIEQVRKLADGTLKMYSTEKRYIRKDGSILWGSLKATTIRNPDGQIIYYLGQIEDITARKEAERAVTESREMLRLVINGVPTMIAYMDTELRFVYLNKAHADWYGKTEDELIGTSLQDLLPPDVFTEALPHFRMVLEGREVAFFESSTRDREGADRVLAVRLVPHLRDGKVAGLFAALNDITSRKRMEDALRESESRFHLMFERHDSIMLLIEPETGKILDANRAAERFYGRLQEELRSLTIQDINALPPEVVSAERKKAAHAGSTFFIFPHRVAGGEIRTVEVHSSPIDMKGRVILFSIINDITERRRAEEALRQANRKLNLLSSITRHDISNQLLVLNGFVELLSKKVTDESASAYFNRIRTAASQIGSMIRFTKEYEMVGINTPVWQDLRKLGGDAAADIPLASVSLENNLPAGAEVFADPLIAKVFFNLLDNALRHGGKITKIRLSLEEADGARIIAVEDDGDGIPAGNKGRIFELGFGKNTGFGLAISKEILDITGIAIRETGTEGQGARFEIVVPPGQFRKRAVEGAFPG